MWLITNIPKRTKSVELWVSCEAAVDEADRMTPSTASAPLGHPSSYADDVCAEKQATDSRSDAGER